MTQNEQIKNILKIRPLTQLEAFQLGIGRLAARIQELRAEGLPISSEQVCVHKANGKLARIAKYSMGA